jgi:hypothetical protein
MLPVVSPLQGWMEPFPFQRSHRFGGQAVHQAEGVFVFWPEVNMPAVAVIASEPESGHPSLTKARRGASCDVRIEKKWPYPNGIRSRKNVSQVK